MSFFDSVVNDISNPTGAIGSAVGNEIGGSAGTAIKDASNPLGAVGNAIGGPAGTVLSDVATPGQIMTDPNGFASAVGGIPGQIGSAASGAANALGLNAPVPQNYVSPGDLAAAMAGSSSGLTNLANTTASLQGGMANGLQAGNTATGALTNQLGAMGTTGIQNQNSVYNQQQALASQLQGMANGQGPSVAQNMLNQTTGQNVANQAALMAGQRGAGSNVGLMARQAAQQGAATQQQAAGQAATLKAQEQLNAIGALQQQQGAMGNLASTQTNQAANTANSLGNLGGSQANLGLGAANAYSNAQQQNLGANMGAAAQQYGGGVSMYNAANTAKQNMIGGLLNGGGTALAALAAKGGEVQGYAKGGSIAPQMSGYYADGGQIPDVTINGPKSMAARYLSSVPKSPAKPTPLFAHGGKAKRPVIGEYLAAKGREVPGKAKVKGDSYSNDIVDAKLSPGEIIIPRSVAQHPNAAALAAKFVAHIKAKKGK